MERGDDICWASSLPDLVTGWCGTTRPARRFVVVETMPEGGWDWIAWRHRSDGDALPGDVLQGAAGTREAAMHDAARAVSRLRDARRQ